jgi:hypothetical protein
LYAPAQGTSNVEVPLPRSAPKEGWLEHVDYFRAYHTEHFQTPFDEFEPAYHYGWDVGNNERLRGKPWSEVESIARVDWERRYPDGVWERFKDAVRRGWERTSEAVERAIPGDSDRDGR